MSNATLGVTSVGGWTATGASGLRASGRFGVSLEPSRNETYSTGTSSGSNQIDTVYEQQNYTLAAAGSLSIDLQGATGQKDVLNNTLSMAKVRRIEVIITSNLGSAVYLRVGPQSVANGFVGNTTNGWWNASTSYNTIKGRLLLDDPADGQVVTGTNKVLTINNPTASAITFTVLICGCSS